MSAVLNTGAPLVLHDGRGRRSSYNQTMAWDMGISTRGMYAHRVHDPERANYVSPVSDTEQDKKARQIFDHVRQCYPLSANFALEIEYVNCAHVQSISWLAADGNRKAFVLDHEATATENTERLQRSLTEAGIKAVERLKYRF